MTFVNERLSTKVAYGFAGGPEWSTQVVKLANGREARNGQWLYPTHRYSAQYKNFERAQQQEILAAFHALRGQLHVCRLKDWNDFTATSETGDWEPLLLPEVGTSNPAQLLKNYFMGSQATARLIQAPVETVTVYRNGIAVTCTIDYETGLVTPASDWVAGTYTWDGEHDVWVRFASDYNAFARNDYRVATADIELVEVRR